MNQWKIKTDTSSIKSGDTRKSALSPVYDSHGGEAKIQLIFTDSGSVQKLYLVLIHPFEFSSITLAGVGDHDIPVGYNFSNVIDENNVKYELSGDIVNIIKKFKKIIIKIHGEDGKILSFVIPGSNSASVIKSISPDNKWVNYFFIPLFFCIMGIFLFGAYYFIESHWENSHPGKAEKNITPKADAKGSEVIVPVNKKSYHFALNCNKIKFYSGEKDLLDNFDELVKSKINSDVKLCVPAMTVILNHCEKFACATKYPLVKEYSSSELNNFYQRNDSILTEINAGDYKRFSSTQPGEEARVSTAPAGKASVTITAPAQPKKINPRTQERSIESLEKELLSEIIQRSHDNLDRGSISGASPTINPETAPKPRTLITTTPPNPARPNKTNTAKKTATPATKPQKTNKSYYFNELDNGDNIRWGYHCHQRAKTMSIIFKNRHQLPKANSLIIEITWPDGAMTSHRAEITDQHSVLFLGKVNPMIDKFNQNRQGLMYVHINYDNNYHWDVEDIFSRISKNSC